MRLTIVVEVERDSGKFVSKEAIFEELEGNLDGDIYVDESIYAVTSVELES